MFGLSKWNSENQNNHIMKGGENMKKLFAVAGILCLLLVFSGIANSQIITYDFAWYLDGYSYVLGTVPPASTSPGGAPLWVLVKQQDSFQTTGPYAGYWYYSWIISTYNPGGVKMSDFGVSWFGPMIAPGTNTGWTSGWSNTFPGYYVWAGASLSCGGHFWAYSPYAPTIVGGEGSTFQKPSPYQTSWTITPGGRYAKSGFQVSGPTPEPTTLLLLGSGLLGLGAFSRLRRKKKK